MGCCGCFGFAFGSKPKKLARAYVPTGNFTSQELLMDEELDDGDSGSYSSEVTGTGNGYVPEMESPTKRSEEIFMHRAQHGLICREFHVRETHKLVRSEDDDGNKMINEYVRECKIGSGSYAKVVLYRSSMDGKHYAIKGFHKSQLSKVRVAPCETAMADVKREILIMKMLDHPNVVNLVEVIDDPTTDHIYMVLEYVEGKLVWEDSVPTNSLLSENKARKYLRDIVAGLMYLHAHNVVHVDIKPDNLLVTATGTVKIGDFGVSQVFQDDNDELRRSPGTPVFTAPECCLGSSYRGKAADAWAVGVTLYCMVVGKYPFRGESVHGTYDKIVNDPLSLPDHLNPLLKDLLEGLLCKDPTKRLTLGDVAEHEWVIGDEGPIPQFLCWCKRKSLHSNILYGNSKNNEKYNFKDS